MAGTHAGTVPPAVVRRRDRRVLLLVGAVAGLLLVGGLVTRGSIVLSRSPDQRIVAVDPATGAVTSGGVVLAAERVRPLFPDVHLVPGVGHSACVDVAHVGEVPLDTVAVRIGEVEGATRLLQQLHLEIERGAPGVADDCAGFVPLAQVTAGTVPDLLEAPAAAGWASWQPVGTERSSYRFTVTLLDTPAAASLQGTRAGVDFLWTATATAVGDGFGEKLALVALGVARDVVPPLLVLLVLAVLFLGVQDRIDRLDPKLAAAAVHEEPNTFRPPPSHARSPE